MLQVSPDLLPALYDGYPKVVVVKPQDPSWTFIPLTDAVRWLIVEKSDSTDFILASVNGSTGGIDRRTLEMPPTNVWAIWSPENETRMTSLAEWWLSAGGLGAQPIFVHGNTAKLSAALIERSLAEVERLTGANQLLIEDLAALRENWAHDVRLPPELEDLLANLRITPPRLVFETPMANGDTEVPAVHSDLPSGLRQRLPIGSRGLLGLDIHVTAPGIGSGALEIKLFALETETELACWRISYDELESGWLPLRLPAASTLNARSLELRVQATGGGTTPRLSLAPVGLLREYACTAFGRDTPSNTMLVFKLWGGIPGVKIVTGSDVVPLPADLVVSIPEHVVAAARSTRELSWAYPYFGYTDGGRVMLRPLRVTPASAACINVQGITGMTAVSCEAIIDDGLCETKLLARLVATHPGQSAEDAEQGIGVLASTEWIELAEPLKPFALTARLPEPQSGPIEIHFFSKLPQGGTLAHGRVIFSRFEALLSERAAWKRGPILPER